MGEGVVCLLNPLDTLLCVVIMVLTLFDLMTIVQEMFDSLPAGPSCSPPWRAACGWR